MTDPKTDMVSVGATSAALKKVGAKLENGKFVVPLKSVNDVLRAASSDGVGFLVDGLDVDKGTARLVIHGNPADKANDLGSVKSIEQLGFVERPANSRCQ
jgi:hypothetical protein